MTGFGGVFIALGAVLAALYGVWLCWRPPSWPKTTVKTGATAALAFAALVLDAPWLIFAGLALGSAGDFALSRPGERAFLAGMGAFAVGHLAYAGVFWMEGNGGLPLLPALALLGLAVSTEVWLAPHTGALRGPARAYVAVIALMALGALTLAPTGRNIATLAGVGLFVLSDLLLAFETFVINAAGPRRVLSHLLWAAYWAGQALILRGMLPAVAG